MTKNKHAKEYANLLQEYEVGKQRDVESQNEVNEEVEGKVQELKIKIGDPEGKRGGQAHNMDHKNSHPSEPEKVLQVYTEEATEELSRKKNELSEVREKHIMIETQRNKEKSEGTQEDVEKIKKKKNWKDDDLRKHTEKDDGKKKRRVFKHAEKRSQKQGGQN